ncbi:hypothetical protein [Phyllobacterium sp. YR531]|uniref:hypothetical protein n=1 Tax=Phyllobacterium sp. YR531 TaxID=1144343 RepID=UPI00026FB23B|nr:hypothetical protein [Phyllobacterium sp. YR531]EJN04213.1 hypothetical protein PMI41_01852 [Phyllobacterium sp. YR531]
MATATNPAQDLVDEEFPSIYRPLVPAALKRAYASADQAFEKLEFLSTPSGKFQRGDLVVLAAEFEFYKLIREGQLPFDPCWEDYASPTGKHLVMKSPSAQITLNQVDYPHQKPRRAIFRDQFAVPNTRYLFAEWNREHDDNQDKKHILLLHGHGDLRFANLSVPHPSQNRLIWWTENLLKVPHTINAGSTANVGEGPTESPDAELVEEIIKTIRDSR